MTGFSKTQLLPTLHVYLCKALCDVFGGRIISSGIWPARSPYFNPCDFFFWGSLKDKVTAVTPETEELKENVPMEFANIPAEHLPSVRGMSACRRTAFSTPPVICEM
jgi:hypothetical protein